VALTSEQWRQSLEAELEQRKPRVALYENYYAGNHRLSFATAKYKEAFGAMFEEFATNWCGLVIDVAAERLGILGFRFGEDSASEDAWQIWQDNSMDARSMQANTEAIKAEASYLLVSPPNPNDPDLVPRITVEHPMQFICAHDPADRHIRLAAFKKYVDTDGSIVNVLYLPDEIITYRRAGFPQRYANLGLVLPSGIGTEDWDTVNSQPNPLGRVPAVPLENAPDLLLGGTSDLKPAIRLNDAANKFFTDMLVASEYTGFPQRVLSGVELPKDPVTGEVTGEVQLKAALNRLWAFEAPDAKAYELKVGDLSNYVNGVDMAVQHLAAQTRTPPHYLLAKLANLSGDALKAAETGLVARCKRKHLDFSDSYEEAMRLSFAWRARARKRAGKAGWQDDEARAKMTDAETLWVNPESQHPTIVADSLVKKAAIGVPDEILWEEAGYTPQQIKRMIVKKAEQQEAEMRMQLKLQEEQAKITKQFAPPPVATAKPKSKPAVPGNKPQPDRQQQ
jgi:hypothetical protein